MRQRIRGWWAAILLGLATIGSYGAAYYSLSVLLPVIAEDTSWGTGALALSFSLATLGQGVVALAAGRLFDSRGSRPVLLPGLVAGALLLLLASFARAPWQFVAAWAAGSAIVGGTLFYNVTMAVTARLYFKERAAAFSVLTLLGALASPIFQPLAGWLSAEAGWRASIQVLVLLMLVFVLPAAVGVNAPAAEGPRGGRPRAPLLAALKEPAVRRVLLVFGLAALANSALLLHQVAALSAAGLSVAAASGFAGARGAFQIPGRLVLGPLISRFRVRGAIGLCYGLAATSAVAVLLAVAGASPLVMGAYFAVVGGISLGLLSPLNGLFQAEVFGDERLGTLSGVTVMVTSIAAAAGAWLAGVAVDVSGSYYLPLGAIACLQAFAVLALWWQGLPGRAGALVESAAPGG